MNKKFMNLSKFELPQGFRGRNPLIVQLWWIVQSTLFAWSPQFMYGWRRMLLRCFGASIGRGVLIRPTATITYPWNLAIGDHSWVGDNVCLYNLGQINIGSNAVISQQSYLCTGSHDYTRKSFPIYAKEITIEDECWLATSVYVGPGVCVGKGAVVGARSSVFKNLEGEMVYMGEPAKLVRTRLMAD